MNWIKYWDNFKYQLNSKYKKNIIKIPSSQSNLFAESWYWSLFLILAIIIKIIIFEFGKKKKWFINFVHKKPTYQSSKCRRNDKNPQILKIHCVLSFDPWSNLKKNGSCWVQRGIISHSILNLSLLSDQIKGCYNCYVDLPWFKGTRGEFICKGEYANTKKERSNHLINDELW